MANSEDPDQMPHSAASDLGLHCLQRRIYPNPFQPKSFVCVEVLRPSQPNGVMSSVGNLPNHTFTGQA